MITEFEIHAFVDNQLASQERARVLEEARKSELLAGHLGELQRLKQLMRRAYREYAECLALDAQPHTPADRPASQLTSPRRPG